MNLGIAVLRAVVGGLFMGHGLQKLKGWFGGGGIEATGENFQKMGLAPGRVHATAAGVSETTGGALLATGFLTPLGASMLTGTMATAIHRVHRKNGPWNTNGGYEYNLVLLAAAFAATADGPGTLSLDALLGRRRWGLGFAMAQLAAGVGGAAAAIKLGERQAQRLAAEEAAQRETARPDEAREPALRRAA
jgi:putative oxidoreductase